MFLHFLDKTRKFFISFSKFPSFFEFTESFKWIGVNKTSFGFCWSLQSTYNNFWLSWLVFFNNMGIWYWSRSGWRSEKERIFTRHFLAWPPLSGPVGLRSSWKSDLHLPAHNLNNLPACLQYVRQHVQLRPLTTLLWSRIQGAVSKARTAGLQK